MLPQTGIQTCQQCIRSMSAPRDRHMKKESEKYKNATFTSVVLSATGGLAKEANTFYKCLAFMLASKWEHNYSSTLCWLRCRLPFSLLWSSIQAIRGARSSCGHAVQMPMAVYLVNAEKHTLNLIVQTIFSFHFFSHIISFVIKKNCVNRLLTLNTMAIKVCREFFILKFIEPYLTLLMYELSFAIILFHVALNIFIGDIFAGLR